MCKFNGNNLNLNFSNQIITQKDLEPFTKLHHIDLSKNDLETLPRELFKFNVDLLVIKVSENKLKFIDATAFETLHKLHTLELDDNQCIWKSTQSRENFDEEDEITRDDVVNVMYEARNRCYRDVILKELYDMEMGKFLKERNEIVVGLETRITELTEENEMFYNKMRDYKDELDVCKMEEIRMMKSSMVGGQNSSSREMKNSNQYFNGQKLPPGGSKNFQEGSKDRNHLENRFNEIPRPSIQNLPLDNPRGFQSPPPGSVKSDQNRFSDMSRSSNGPNAYLPLDREPQMPKIDDKKRPQSGIPSIMLLEPRNVPQAPSGDFNQRPNYPERDDFYANRSPDEKLPSGYTPSSPTRPFNVDHAKMPYDDRVNERENAYAKDSYMLRSQEQNYGQQWSNWGKRSDNWRY